VHDRYFNHAHNDWVEILLTGGLPFALIALVALAWLVVAFAGLGTHNLIRGQRGDLRLAVGTILSMLLAASFVDYPLRIPSIQVMALVLTVFLCCPKPATRRANLP